MDENIFFLPAHTGNIEDREKTYLAIKKFVSEQCGELSNSRVRSIVYVHEGKVRAVEVGTPSSINGEVVVAIFRNESLFLVCTYSRGVAKGMPILVGSHEVKEAEYFKPID